MTGIAPQTELAIEMLGKGVPRAQVCNVLGITPSTLSEIATTYADQIELQTIGTNLMAYEMDVLRDELELQSLNQLKRCLPLETDPLKLTRIATAINGMARRSTGERPQAGAQINNVQVTNITLPANFMKSRQEFEQSVVLNAASEVVAIGDQTTAPASRDQIQMMAANLGNQTFAHLLKPSDL